MEPNDTVGFFDIEAPAIHGVEFNKLVRELGNVSYAWNSLHAELGDLFISVTGLDTDLARAIWHSHKSDSGARDMLLAATLQQLHVDQLVYAEAKWLIDETGRIAAYRNDAAHVLWDIDHPDMSEMAIDPIAALTRRKVRPNAVRGNPRAARLAALDAPATFRSLANYCMDLVQFARAFHVPVHQLRNKQLFRHIEPLPQRPQRPPSLPDNPRS